MSYEEPARTFRGPVITFLAFVAGFGLDGLFGGAIAHLPGWIIAAVLVVGVHLLATQAARSTHSLRLDADELRVGDDAVARDEIVGVAAGIEPDAKVLGWAVTPKRPRGVTIRLADGRDLGVLTRHPVTLSAALGVAAPEEPGQDPVRPATPDDLPLLAEIDERAGAVFRVAGFALPDDVDRPLLPAREAFVIGDPPVAFVLLDEVDGAAYVAEISVLPAHMRQGLGSRLMAAAEEWARESGFAEITLTTYADVPWNAPWYRGLGYAEWDDPGPGLLAIRAKESEIGLESIGRRIVMRRSLR